MEGNGQSSKLKRLENLHSVSACEYTSQTGKHEEKPKENEWKVASLNAILQKINKPPRLKLQRTGAFRSMYAALRLNVLTGARSGFKRSGSFAD